MDVVGTSHPRDGISSLEAELAETQGRLELANRRFLRMRDLLGDFLISEEEALAESLKKAQDEKLETWTAHQVEMQALQLQHAEVIHSRAWRFGSWARAWRHRLFPDGGWSSQVGKLIFLPLLGLKRLVKKKPLPPSPAPPPPAPKYATQYDRWIAECEAPRLAAIPELPSDANVPYLRFLIRGEGNYDATLESLQQQSDPAWTVSGTGLPNLNGPIGGYLAIIQAGDRLHPRAVSLVRRAIYTNPGTELIFSDEDRFENGCRVDPTFKPQWTQETYRSHDSLGAFKVFAIDAVNRVGGLSHAFHEVPDYELALRLTENGAKSHRITEVLIHTQAREATPSAREQMIRAVTCHLDRLSISGDVGEGLLPMTQHVRYTFHTPLISIIIPSKDQPRLLEQCIASIRRSSYPHREIVIVDNQSQNAETHTSNRRLAQLPDVRFVHFRETFNFAAMNNYAVPKTKGEVLVFLNNDTEIIDPDWLERMLEHAIRPDVGAVGAKLFYPDGRIQHAGLILGMLDGTCGHLHRYFPEDSDGHGRRLKVVHDLSAVTAACMMVRREVFDEVKGFEELFASDFNDIDFCLRLRERDYRIVWTPFAKLWHHEGVTRGDNVALVRQRVYKPERTLFLQRWGKLIADGDPFFNPNLNLLKEDAGLRW